MSGWAGPPSRTSCTRSAGRTDRPRCRRRL
jgi:hypothetical protein